MDATGVVDLAVVVGALMVVVVGDLAVDVDAVKVFFGIEVELEPLATVVVVVAAFAVFVVTFAVVVATFTVVVVIFSVVMVTFAVVVVVFAVVVMAFAGPPGGMATGVFLPITEEGLPLSLLLPPIDVGSTGSASIFLCFELESLSLSFFLLGFFMFLTTLPVDFTGARLLFIGIIIIVDGSDVDVAIVVVIDVAASVGGGGVSTFSEPMVVVFVVVVVVVECGRSSKLVGIIEVFSVTMTAGSHRLMHLHGLLFSTGNPKRKT